MTKELYTYIGQAIKESRRTTFKHKIITQSELAKVCGVTFQQIQKYEKASNKIPLDKLLTISKHVNKTLLDFLPADNPQTTVFCSPGADPVKTGPISNIDKSLNPLSRFLPI